jgi:steroid delta-isomerase-like uncharacterized protein
LDEFVSPDFITHSSPQVPGMKMDLDAFKKVFVMFQTATPGYHTVDVMIAEGDIVAAHITGYGTHEAEFLGVPATHKQIQMSGMVMWRIKDGKIVEHWGVNDTMDLLRQLGTLAQSGDKPQT